MTPEREEWFQRELDRVERDACQLRRCTSDAQERRDTRPGLSVQGVPRAAADRGVMSTRVYLAIELDHQEGPKLTREQQREQFEDEIFDVEQWLGASLYSVKVLGIGANPAELDESIKRRKG